MDDKKINRSDAGEPGKANISKPKDVKISNYVKAKDSFSKPDRGDIVVEKNKENKIESQSKVTENILTKANEKKVTIKKADASKDKMKLSNGNNLRETKYNKIMESINKIIEENIHLINTNTKSTDPTRKVVEESSKVAGESNINKQNTKLKEPEKQYKSEAAKDDAALVDFRKKADGSKAPLDVVKTSNDVKNKSLVINLPKQVSGCKLEEKPKVSKDQVSPQPKLNSFQQRKASQTTENYGVKPIRNIIHNKSNSTKIQTEKPKMLKIDSTTRTKENHHNHTKKSTLQNAKVKHVKRKNAKKVESPKNGSQTKLIPMLEDEHAKLYYEAWLNNTVTVTAQEQQILEDAAQRYPSVPVITEMASEDYTDKKFTGIIKIKYGKNIKQSCEPSISIK
ncbi:uncharacterized protein LOC121736378 [Aricia agestis]|uniref:uncharacterized protein LOC121736378 n=1 Tax=Aricia agestis TaxID=91739 RepID=UPI001C2019FD|nr:uncharacterized protein LOC121736378 [Aricia agestis]